MEGYDYDAAARTVKIEDITSDETNRKILRQLNEDDPEFDRLCINASADSKTTKRTGSSPPSLPCLVLRNEELRMRLRGNQGLQNKTNPRAKDTSYFALAVA